jgi:hypothetical protein
MNRALTTIAVGLLLYLTGAAASPAETRATQERADDCSSVARFQALVLQGEKLIAEGSESQGESVFTRAKRLRLSERQRTIERGLRASLDPEDETYLEIYRTCWDDYWYLTTVQRSHDPRSGANGGACYCPPDDLCEWDAEGFGS